MAVMVVVIAAVVAKSINSSQSAMQEVHQVDSQEVHQVDSQELHQADTVAVQADGK